MTELPKIWVLSVNHKHGTNVSAHFTEEGALLALAEYVGEWWAHERAEEAMPGNDGDAIQQYFNNSDESFSIDECGLS